MMLSKRGAALFIALSLLATYASGQSSAYPLKPIRWIVPYPPGGSFDGFSRVVAAQLSLGLGQPVVIENRVGAGGIIGSEAGAKAAADGYTLVSGDNGTLVYNPLLYRKLPYDPQRDLQPVGLYARVPLFITASDGTGFRSLNQLVSAAREAPGKITYASSGNGSPQHLAMELLKRRANIDLLHIPYKGTGLAMQDLLAGRVDMSVMTLGAIRSSAGKLRPLANTDEARMSALPEVPTVMEAGVANYTAIAWWMLLTPAGTPREIVRRLGDELGKALTAPTVAGRAIEFGAEIPNPSTESANDLLRKERAQWGPVVTALGLVLD